MFIATPIGPVLFNVEDIAALVNGLRLLSRDPGTEHTILTVSAIKRLRDAGLYETFDQLRDFLTRHEEASKGG